MKRGEHLVDAEWLRAHLFSPEVVIVDVRWNGRDAYDKEHIQGAHFVDLDDDLSSPTGGGAHGGRHPLPTAEAFARLLSRLGVTRKSVVVAYDDRHGGIAARMWWLMRYFDVGTCYVLDGGLDAWTDGLVSDAARDKEAPLLDLRPNSSMAVTADDVAALGDDTVLIDARAPERFRGEVEPIDPVAGHIDGAVNVPWADNLVDGRFADTDALAERFSMTQDKRVVVYCGSGVTACHDLLALARMGRDDAQLYVGSWSDWCTREQRVAD